MPCDKFMELPLEDRLDTGCFDVPIGEVAYYIRVNKDLGSVEYLFPSSSSWVVAD